MADLIAEARFPAPKYRTEGFFTKFEDITTADLLAFAAQNDIKGDHIEVTTYKGNVRTDKIQPKWELVGTHTGRRTFIVNALSLGITPNIVMKWTGHSDYKAMKPYIDIVDSIKASSMTKFDGLI